MTCGWFVQFPIYKLGAVPLVAKQTDEPDNNHDGNGNGPEREEEQEENPPSGMYSDHFSGGVNDSYLLGNLGLKHRWRVWRSIGLLIISNPGGNLRLRRDWGNSGLSRSASATSRTEFQISRNMLTAMSTKYRCVL